MDFGKWLKNTSDLSDSSVYKYTHAVKTISDDMLSEGVIDKPLADMELYEVDLAIAVIFHTPFLRTKIHAETTCIATLLNGTGSFWSLLRVKR